MSMEDPTTLARKIALASDEKVAWDLMRNNTKAFIWTDDEEPEETWNLAAARAGSKQRLTVDWGAGDKDERPTLILGDKRRLVPLTYTREDKFTVIPHAIAQIGKDILEMRYCKASGHSSDKAYLPCSPSGWRSLEAELGADRLAKQFLAVPDDLQAFTRMFWE